VKDGHRFIIIAGGGKTARRYQDAVLEVAHLDNEDLDWIGIHATRLNGHLLRTIFKTQAHSVMITNPDDILDVPAGERSLGSNLHETTPDYTPAFHHLLARATWRAGG